MPKGDFFGDFGPWAPQKGVARFAQRAPVPSDDTRRRGRPVVTLCRALDECGVSNTGARDAITRRKTATDVAANAAPRALRFGRRVGAQDAPRRRAAEPDEARFSSCLADFSDEQDDGAAEMREDGQNKRVYQLSRHPLPPPTKAAPPSLEGQDTAAMTPPPPSQLVPPPQPPPPSSSPHWIYMPSPQSTPPSPTPKPPPEDRLKQPKW